MNQVYKRMFKIGIKRILDFISLSENFEERKLVRGFSIIYDTTNRVFSAIVDFETGEDYKLFHNIIAQFIPGVNERSINEIYIISPKTHDKF
jgi:hypothetical protein